MLSDVGILRDLLFSLRSYFYSLRKKFILDIRSPSPNITAFANGQSQNHSCIHTFLVEVAVITEIEGSRSVY